MPNKRSLYSVLLRIKSKAEAAKQQVKPLRSWLHHQHEALRTNIPERAELERWLQINAPKFGWTEKPRSDSLEHLEQVLTEINAAIKQQSNRRVRILVKTLLGKTAGAITIAGIGGSITAFGAAAAGAPIAALSGAAATTAQLYWLGSMVGLGVAAGGVILAGTGLGAGLVAGIWGRRWLLGRHRTEQDMQDHEAAIISASFALIAALRKQIEGGVSPSASDMRLVAEHALIPMVNSINQHWDERSLKESGITECIPFTKSLSLLHRKKLSRCRTELGRISLRLIAIP